VKLFCALTIEPADLERGLDIIERSIEQAMGRHLKQVS
jgi:4-aminobutyrate aminotransferase-like enzyme